MLRNLAFSVSSKQQTLYRHLRRQRLNLLIHAVNVGDHLQVFLLVEVDIQIQYRLHAEHSLLAIEILPHFHIALSQMILDIGNHVFPAAVALDNAAERHGVLIPLCFVVIPLALIQEKGAHLPLNRKLLFKRLKLHMVETDMVPYGLEHIGQIARQFHLLFQPENIFLVQHKFHHGINALAVLHRFLVVKVNRRLTLHLLLPLKCKGNHRLHTEFPGIDQPHRQIFDTAFRQDRVAVIYPFHIYLFLKGNHRLHAGAHPLHVRQIQYGHHQLSFQADRVFTGADLLHNDLAFTA